MKKKRSLERISQEPFLELTTPQTRRVSGGYIPTCSPSGTYGTTIGHTHDVESPIYC